MKMNRDKFQIFSQILSIHNILGLYQTGQVLAIAPVPNSACYMQELLNGGPFKIRFNCKQFPILHKRTFKISTHKL